MKAEEIAARFPDARPTSNGWDVHCPAHEDHNASLGIAEGTAGRVLLNCRAGCKVELICAALGIHLWDLFPADPAKPQRPRMVKAYDYTDPTGKLLFQVCRFDPKDFNQRRPNPDKPGTWLWNMKGIHRVLYRLPAVLAAVAAGRPVFMAEGEKDCNALAALGLCATCNPGGAVSINQKTGKLAKWESAFTETLTGAKVIVLLDKDESGRRHAALVQSALQGKAASVQVVELPDRNGRTVKDPADWIAAGGTAEEFLELVRNAPAWEPPPEEPTAAPAASVETKGKPAVLLPAGEQSISETGHALGFLLAKTERFFIRGGAVVKLARDPDGLPHLEDVKPAALASDFEGVALLCKPDGPDNVAAATCPEQTAKLIAASAAFRAAMRSIHVLTRCPVLIERAGSLIQVSGYDRESGIFAAGTPAEPMDVAEARRLLSEILAGFRFATPADRARALAAMVTPALVFGGLLRGRAPVDLAEADASQTGKGYKNKLTAAVYAQSVKTVTQQRAGVGSMEESFNMALIRGANFIALDNVRGKIDSPSFESFLTEDTYIARAPYRQPVEIDPRRVVIMLTSNKADVTPDLANRAACVRLLKQPEGHAFTPYPEGDILEHVRTRQARYLGAVFAIVRAWHEAGKPRTAETRHDFRPWAQTLDWITRNLLDAGPLLDGHRETQARMTNPVLNWLRDVALDVIRARQAGAWLRTAHLVDLLAETGTETPGLPEHGDLTDPETRKAAQQAAGRRLGLCFRAGDVLTLDGMTVVRREVWDTEHRFNVKEYRFTPAAMEAERIAARPPPPSNPPPKHIDREPELDFCGYAAANAAADSAAMGTLAAANAADTLAKCEYGAATTKTREGDIDSMGTISRIAAMPVTAAVETEEGEI